MAIPLLSDINKTIARDFGVLVENPADGDCGLALRATIIVDGKGVVRSITVNDLGVGRNVDETLRLVTAFQHVDAHGEEVCPAGWKKGESISEAQRSGSRCPRLCGLLHR